MQTPKRLAVLDWPWKSEDPAIHIILISDEQFVNLANRPDEAVEKMYPWADTAISLHEYCRQAANRGATTLRLAYDYFFGGSERSLYPDTEAFQDALKKVHDVAAGFDIGLEPSVLSPLELGVGYQTKTGEAGRWLHYREGLRDPQTGAYSVMLWQQTQWCNNKGPTPVTLIGARAFAFREERIAGTPFFAVSSAEIVELAPPHIEELPGARIENDAHYKAVRVRAWGDGGSDIGPLDRVLVVLIYRTVEMDYFSPSAPKFLADLVQQYHERAITFTGLYADETHIQGDWSYHSHMDNGQFAVRYVSPGFERAFAERFGAEYGDFAKYMVYFACHQHDFLPTHEPKLPSQHVFGPGRDDIGRTLLFRRNYYRFLEHSVVQLMVDARDKIEHLNGRPMDIYYHSTWAESPTCDAWASGGVHESWSAEEHRRQYEYTPDFVWSNTVHQAASACADQFAWNEYLTGGNDDTPEGGFSDRDYYGRALACSLAALNRRPLASAGMWGMPAPVADRMMAVSEVFGALGHPAFRSVADYAPRQIEALFLYPQDLVAVDERFGSWMVQYGYANLITAEKLAEYGRVTDDGLLAVKDSRYCAVCALYEPFPSEALLNLLEKFVRKGGTVVWSSTPPLDVGQIANLPYYTALFGIDLEGVCPGSATGPTTWGSVSPSPEEEATAGQSARGLLGLALPGRQVTFTGALASVAAMPILTDFVVDRVFPARPLEGTEVVATLRTGGASRPLCVGTRRLYPGGGQAVYLGFRPRDDQSASTGVETRTWFEILHALGVYPPSGRFPEQESTLYVNDNPTVISRTTGYLATAFPNGAMALCPHYRDHEESWPGGFFRDEEADRRIVAANPVPDDAIDLAGFHVAGQTVAYRGRHAVAWRRAAAGNLVAFAGNDCTGITLDGRAFTWADEPVDIAWHPIPPAADTPELDHRPLYRIWCGAAGRVAVPLNLPDAAGLEVWRGAFVTQRKREGFGRAGYGDCLVPFEIAGGALILNMDEELAGHWLYVVQAKK
jgi:hypothetical protein